MRQFLFISILGLTACPPDPKPDPEPTPPDKVADQQAVENAVIVTETMASSTFATNCERTRVAWEKIDSSSLAKAKEASVERTSDQKTRYDAAIKEAAKVIPNCRGETQCAGGCPDCEWVNCVEHLIACPADVERCCFADACIAGLE